MKAAAKLPMVTVFTAAHEIGARIDTAYRSLLRQSYRNWEWVVTDDSRSSDTAEHLASLVEREPPGRIRLCRQPASGSIGASKAAGAKAGRGDFLVELDHDDELLPEALELVVATFLAHPDVDFVFSDWIDWQGRREGDGPALYPEGWGFGLGAYASEIVNGRRVPVALTPPLTAETVRHIVATPNHVRAWRKDFYHQLGGHDPRLPVADDFELVVRTFLKGVMARIPRPLYVQHHHPDGGNTSRRRNAEIQQRVAEIVERYEQAIHRRCLSLAITPSTPPANLTDWRPIPRADRVIDVIAEAQADSGRPLVSVAVPTYRRASSLGRALASILAQSYENLEVLVVGDGCPNVEQVIASIDDPRVRHWNLAARHQDSGAGPRNQALKVMARGTLIAYLDDDNVWREDHLGSLVDLLQQAPSAAFAFASFEMGGETIVCRRPRQMQIDTSALLHRSFLLERFGYWRGTQAIDSHAHDWELVSRWERETWAASLEPTVRYSLERSCRGQRLLAEVKKVAEEERAAALLLSS